MSITADDLSYFVQVARQARLTLAGQVLGVSHTTVSRRIGRLEHDLGVRLFDRGSGGWKLTEAGRRLLVHAETVGDALDSAKNIAKDPTEDLSGTVRLVTPDGFGTFLLAPSLAPLRAQHPQLQLEIMTSSQRSSFTAREFDIAVTMIEPSPRAVWFQQLLKYKLGLYATREYLTSHPEIKSVDDLEGHTLIFYVEEALDIAPLHIMSEMLPKHTAKIQINNIAGHWSATRAGLGIGPMPDYIGESDPNLVRVLPDAVEAERTYWLVIPRGLMRLPRVRAVGEFLTRLVLPGGSGEKLRYLFR